MQKLALLFRVPYTLYAAITYVIFLTFGFIYALLLSYTLGNRAAVPIFAYYKFWAKAWYFLVGIRMEVRGCEHLQASHPCIIAGNHSTHLDLMNAVYFLPLKSKALAKAEIRKIPLMGYQFSIVSVFVDRSSKESREQSLREMQRRLAEGFSIFIYPEGTRNRTSQPLKEFYDGAFRIAIETQKPLLPVVVLNGRTIMSVHDKTMRPGKMTTIFLPPFSTDGLTVQDVPQLKQAVYDAMEACVLQHDPYFLKK